MSFRLKCMHDMVFSLYIPFYSALKDSSLKQQADQHLHDMLTDQPYLAQVPVLPRLGQTQRTNLHVQWELNLWIKV